MPELAGPASVPPLSGPADVYVETYPLGAPSPPPPTPDLTADYTPAATGPLVRVLLGQAVEVDNSVVLETVGCLETAEVADWAEDVDVLAPQAATVTASSWDPLWAAVGDLVGVSADGHLVYEWDPKGYLLWIEVDGVLVWTGVFRAPVDIGGGRVGLPAVSPSAIFAERILGRAEQLDRLEGRGSFEEYSSQADMEADGWAFDPGVTAAIVADPVRGAKALQVTGNGWVSSPKVTLEGADGYGRTIEAAAFGKFNISIPQGAVCVAARAVQISNGAEDSDYRYNEQGVRPDEESGWTKAPITAGGRMQPVVAAHRCWTEVRSFAGVDTRYDLVTLRQGITTGAPPGSSQDLTWYVERVFRDLHSRELGGSPTWLKTRVLQPCGTEAVGMRWAHNQRTPFRDVLTMILDRDGGPECRITPNWNLEITDRLGSDRDDIGLSVHDIVDPGLSIDAGAQVDDLVVDTGIGAGTSWVSVTKSTPRDAVAHRIVSIITAPVDRSLNELDPWAQAFAEAAGRVQRTATVAVLWHVAAQISTGDSVWITQHDGLQGVSQRMRVLTKRFRPSALLVDLTLGPVDG